MDLATAGSLPRAALPLVAPSAPVSSLRSFAVSDRPAVPGAPLPRSPRLNPSGGPSGRNGFQTAAAETQERAAVSHATLMRTTMRKYAR